MLLNYIFQKADVPVADMNSLHDRARLFFAMLSGPHPISRYYAIGSRPLL
ncbi:hypothetical protein HMPREF1141_2345 [Clostridium sp. MSTE9]|nr:hypothetical protein HMPREF1141_2345 [Clostridium sp. MSTE9]